MGRGVETITSKLARHERGASNRGTLRLQYREWAALVDLQASVDMDGDRRSVGAE